MVRRMKTEKESLNSALKTRVEWIESLVEENKLAEAIDAIQIVENQQEIDNFSIERGVYVICLL